MATGGGIIGRAPELDTLREIPRALLLTGEAGIGKTTLWQAGIDVAQATGRRVLAARPSEAEALHHSRLLGCARSSPSTSLGTNGNGWDKVVGL